MRTLQLCQASRADEAHQDGNEAPAAAASAEGAMHDANCGALDAAFDDCATSTKHCSSARRLDWQSCKWLSADDIAPDGEPSLGFEPVQRATGADHERWASDRARHWPYGSRPRPGDAIGTRLALCRAHGHTLLCRSESCCALVDLQAARCSARRAGRDCLEAGDGCASAVCSAHPSPGRFARGQQQMAEALVAGDRLLVLWPPTAAARTELWSAPTEWAHAAACTAR